jgi:hypothetical protein
VNVAEHERRATHLIVVRAGDEDPAGRHAEARVGWDCEPADEVLEDYRRGVAAMFRASFGDEPTRVAAVVLPYIDELDADDDEGAYE